MCVPNIQSSGYGNDEYNMVQSDMGLNTPGASNIGAGLRGQIGRGTSFVNAQVAPYAQAQVGPFNASIEKNLNYYRPDEGDTYKSRDIVYSGGVNIPAFGGNLNLSANKDQHNKGVFLRYNTEF